MSQPFTCVFPVTAYNIGNGIVKQTYARFLRLLKEYPAQNMGMLYRR
jgi:hypothetical protein